MMTFSSRRQKTLGNLGWRERVPQRTQKTSEPRFRLQSLYIYHKTSTVKEALKTWCLSTVLIRIFIDLFQLLTSSPYLLITEKSVFTLFDERFADFTTMCWQSFAFLALQELFRKVRSILNKLTPQMFHQLMKQVTDLTINTEERLKGVIDLVFEKAIDEPSFSVAYANMCRCLATVRHHRLLLVFSV